jgi:hypothetical protein
VPRQVSQDLDLRIAIDLDRRSVGEHHFDASIPGSQSIPLHDRHVHDDGLQFAAPIDGRAAIHI